MQGCNLDVINLTTNERLAAWSFSSLDSADPEAEITCLALLSAEPSSNNPSHVILGLDTGLHGALAVFDITEGRVGRSLVGRVGRVSMFISQSRFYNTRSLLSQTHTNARQSYKPSSARLQRQKVCPLQLHSIDQRIYEPVPSVTL